MTGARDQRLARRIEIRTDRRLVRAQGQPLHAHERIDMSTACAGGAVRCSRQSMPDYSQKGIVRARLTRKAFSQRTFDRRSSQLDSRHSLAHQSLRTHQTIEYPPPSPGTNHGVRASMQNIMRDDSMPEQLNTELDPRWTLRPCLLAAVLCIRGICMRGHV